MKIQVTARDIRVGTKLCKSSSACEVCPIALAASRAFGLPCLVTGRIYVELGHVFSMSGKALKFMRDFDGGKKVLPFGFTSRRVR
jgi:hypothetical protein